MGGALKGVKESRHPEKKRSANSIVARLHRSLLPTMVSGLPSNDVQYELLIVEC